MTSEYILVEWKLENKYSVVKRASIVLAEEKVKTDIELIGQEVLFLWRSKPYAADVIQCGTKTNMTHELGVLIQLQTNDNNEQVSIFENEPQNLLVSEIESILHESFSTQNTEAENTSNKTRQEIEIELENEKEKSKFYKKKYKSLKRKYNAIQKDNDKDVQKSKIGKDVYLPTSQLDTILSMSDTPNALARNLLKSLYKENELSNRSLFGLPCNAVDKPTNPAIDSVRRNAIIRFTLAQYGPDPEANVQYNEEVKKLMKHKLHSSMGDFLRNINKKIRKDALLF